MRGTSSSYKNLSYENMVLEMEPEHLSGNCGKRCRNPRGDPDGN
jgi:hypothetical protein